MARIRTIKPEFFTSEDIVALSPLARLLYIALWCEADKEGRLPWKPMTFKLRYLPGDACDVAALCDELLARGLIVLYGDALAYIPQFRAHQHINPREAESRYPSPDGHEARAIAADDAPTDPPDASPPGTGAPVQSSDAPPRVPHASARVNDASARVPHAQGGREGKGRERNTPPSGGVARARRASRLPDDWTLPDDWRCWAQSERPDLDPDRTADRFADHWRAAAGQRGVKADWLATWRNWVRGERAPPRPAAPPGRAAESFRERDARQAAERVAQFAPALADRSALAGRNSPTVVDIVDTLTPGASNVVAIASR